MLPPPLQPRRNRVATRSCQCGTDSQSFGERDGERTESRSCPRPPKCSAIPSNPSKFPSGWSTRLICSGGPHCETRVVGCLRRGVIPRLPHSRVRFRTAGDQGTFSALTRFRLRRLLGTAERTGVRIAHRRGGTGVELAQTSSKYSL
jgi:hypothetical protein